MGDVSNRAKCLWVVVNYNTPEMAYRLATQVASCYNSTDVVVVDNSADLTDRQSGDLKRRGVRVLADQENLGYFPGAWSAISPRLDEGYELVVISNSDLRLGEDFNHCEITCRSDISELGWVSPISGHDSVQPLLREPSRLRLALLAIVVLFGVDRIANVGRRRGRNGRSPEIPSGATLFSGVGSLVILPAAFFEHGGSLSDFSFLYGEEIMLGRLCERLGLKCLALDVGTYWHDAHASTASADSELARSPVVRRHQFRSLVRLITE